MLFLVCWQTGEFAFITQSPTRMMLQRVIGAFKADVCDGDSSLNSILLLSKFGGPLDVLQRVLVSPRC